MCIAFLSQLNERVWNTLPISSFHANQVEQQVSSGGISPRLCFLTAHNSSASGRFVLDMEDCADTAFRRAVQDLDAHINAPRFLRWFILFLACDTFDGLA